MKGVLTINIKINELIEALQIAKSMSSPSITWRENKLIISSGSIWIEKEVSISTEEELSFSPISIPKLKKMLKEGQESVEIKYTDCDSVSIGIETASLADPELPFECEFTHYGQIGSENLKELLMMKSLSNIIPQFISFSLNQAMGYEIGEYSAYAVKSTCSFTKKLEIAINSKVAAALVKILNNEKFSTSMWTVSAGKTEDECYITLESSSIKITVEIMKLSAISYVNLFKNRKRIGNVKICDVLNVNNKDKIDIYFTIDKYEAYSIVKAETPPNTINQKYQFKISPTTWLQSFAACPPTEDMTVFYNGLLFFQDSSRVYVMAPYK